MKAGQVQREPERSAAIGELLRDRPELAGRLSQRQEDLEIARGALASGDYEQMGSDPDLYKYFCQRWRQILRSGGYIGVVLPRTAFNAKGSEGFRRWLYSSSRTHRIDFLVNTKGWVFPDVTGKYTISLVVAERADPRGAWLVEVLGTAGSAREWSHQASQGGVKLRESALGSGLETPLLRSQDEADLLSRLRVGNRFPFGPGIVEPSVYPPPPPPPENLPKLGAGVASPSPSSTRPPTRNSGAFPVRELDETNDKRFWQGRASGTAADTATAPLWKGESFGQYDPRGVGERLCPITDALQKKVRKPRPGLKSLLARDHPVASRRKAVRMELGRARVAFRDVARGTDPRTIIACLIPPGVFLTNTAPYLAFIDGDPVDQAACLGIMNSLPFDWQARRFIEIHASFFLLEGLYLPDLNDTDFRAISQAAARLSAVDDRFADFAAATGVTYGPLDPADRERLRVDIDARVARAWDLSVADLDVVFRDFTEDAVTPAYRTALVERMEQLA